MQLSINPILCVLLSTMLLTASCKSSIVSQTVDSIEQQAFVKPAGIRSYHIEYDIIQGMYCLDAYGYAELGNFMQDMLRYTKQCIALADTYEEQVNFNNKALRNAVNSAPTPTP